MSRDAIVIGGGIVGASVAYHLARAATDVVLLDRADEGRATDAGAGIVSPATSSRTGSPDWFRFATAATEYYPELADRLAAEQGGPVGYDRPGLLAVALDPGEAAELDAELDRVRDRQERFGAPREGSIEVLDADAAAERFPPLAAVERAFVYEDAARVNGTTVATALRAAAETHGADVVEGSAERLLLDGGGVRGVATRTDEIRGKAVVVAGGAWSAEWADQLDLDVPVEPQRGQIAHLDAGETDGWPMVKGYGGHYLVPRPDGTVLAGATREDGTGYDPRPTPDGVRTVLDELLRVAPGLADATFEEVRVGLRPVSPDGLPLVGAAPGVDGAYLATGHGPTGLTLGPFSGKVVADLVRGASPGVDLDPFDPVRF